MRGETRLRLRSSFVRQIFVRQILPVMLIALAALIAGQSGAEAQIKTKKADCYFEKAGQVHIDGTCEFLTDAKYYGAGGFRIANYDSGYVRYFAEVSLLEGPATGTWNEERGRKPMEVTNGNLGPLRSDGACWVGRDSRLCAWKIGEGRPGAAPGVYGTASPPSPPSSPPAETAGRSARAADCFFEWEGTTLIDGECDFTSDPASYGAGGFRIDSYTGNRLRHHAILTITEPGRAGVEFNTVPGNVRTIMSSAALSKDGACWSKAWNGKSTRICAWKPGEGRPGFIAGAAPARPPADEDKPVTSQGTTTWTRDCFFETDGKVVLDGPCRFMKNEFYGPGGFALANLMSDTKLYVIEVRRQAGEPDGIGRGFWNGRSGHMQVATPFGDLTANGACWENERARLCAWKRSENRPGFQRERTANRESLPPPAAKPPPPSGGGQPPEKATRLTLTFHGTCQQLVVDGENATPRCSPVMTNMSVTGQATTEFAFFSSDGIKLVFIGRGQGKTEGSALLQPIGALSLEEGGATLRKDAKGRCRLPDPNSGAITIECDATTENSAYTARFQTDGRRPEVDERGP